MDLRDLMVFQLTLFLCVGSLVSFWLVFSAAQNRAHLARFCFELFAAALFASAVTFAVLTYSVATSARVECNSS